MLPRIPVIKGTIKRRLLVNFRVDPATLQSVLPAPFRPKLHRGWAIAGICLIRLEHIRPAGLPAALGVSSENAAHRIAVEWADAAGMEREGVFIPRRDTGSRLNSLAGGRIFPGEHHHATFTVSDDGHHIDLAMDSDDRQVSVQVVGDAGDTLPTTSCFDSLLDVSSFFEGGCLGYSVTRDNERLDGLLLRTLEWQVQAMSVTTVQSSYFDDRNRFPAGTAEFDHALVMRDIPHEWHQAEDLYAVPRSV
jgi:uncharacterized protein YqjF (DUF2071 family)